MKKLIFILAVTLVGCTTAVVDKNSENSKRIIIKETNVYVGMTYQIIEVDGNEFLCQYHGGMCLIPKDSIN